MIIAFASEGDIDVAGSPPSRQPCRLQINQNLPIACVSKRCIVTKGRLKVRRLPIRCLEALNKVGREWSWLGNHVEGNSANEARARD